MTETTALLPCPFCGGDAEIERIGDARRSTIYRCTYCGCSLETGEEWGHGRRWNERSTPPALPAAPVAEGWRPMGSAPKDRTNIIVAVRSGRAPRPVLLGVVAAQRGVLDAEGITDEKARTILLATFNRMWEDSERDQPDEWFLFDIDFQEILDGAAAGARRVRTWIVPADSRGSWWLTAKGRDLFDTILYASLKAWHAEPGQRTRHG